MTPGTIYYQDTTNVISTDQLNQCNNSILEAFNKLIDLTDSLSMFANIRQEEDIPEIEKIASYYRNTFEDVIILGTGGSSLGGQALVALRKTELPRLHFQDNIDPMTFDRLFQRIDPQKTGVIAISKSGNTAETLVQLLLCLQHWQKTVPVQGLKTYFTIISEPGKNAIRDIAAYHTLPSLDHDPEIGGRYAALTLVGLLPAYIAGIDGRAARQGARKVLGDLRNSKVAEEFPPLLGAAINVVLAEEGYSQAIFMPYIDRLAPFALWHRQLWAESLGKDGFGTTPVPALGAVDQHSQLQLYLDGPKDKFFTILTMEHSEGEKINASPYSHPYLAPFMGKTMSNLLAAEQQATIDTLRHHHCPTRVIHLTHLDEEVLGALMMHFFLETLAASCLWNVHPLNQPAVEEGKILAQQYLRSLTT